ncbi:thioredoxin-like protein [Roridomyces roridus]|uniref:Thioredoxin-like protein n=1 Tax=Roridomyces roridus TaxID=1738132 RepID=A0AAD7C291_9AGAR|nr:thioredoxin-like protein [Roridomyces roridus]
MSAPVDIQSIQQWNDILEASTEAGKTIIVDFSAEWCPPCRAIAPRYELLASKNPHVQFLRVDVDEQRQIAESFQVTAMPTFFAIRDQDVVGMLRGADPQGLARLVQKHGGPEPGVAETQKAVL